MIPSERRTFTRTEDHHAAREWCARSRSSKPEPSSNESDFCTILHYEIVPPLRIGTARKEHYADFAVHPYRTLNDRLPYPHRDRSTVRRIHEYAPVPSPL